MDSGSTNNNINGETLWQLWYSQYQFLVKVWSRADKNNHVSPLERFYLGSYSQAVTEDPLTIRMELTLVQGHALSRIVESAWKIPS